MEKTIDYIKTGIASIVSSMIVYFDPVAGKLESLMALFLVNFAVGYISSKVVDNEDFKMSKFKECFIWAATILVIVCAFYFIGERNGNKDGTIECLHIAILVAIWAFGTNILRNLCKLSKGNEPVYNLFWACYYWISFDFVRKIPFLSGLAAERGKNDAERLGETLIKPTIESDEDISSEGGECT